MNPNPMMAINVFFFETNDFNSLMLLTMKNTSECDFPLEILNLS